MENGKRAERDLKEAVWRAYKNVFLLAEDNSLRKIDLGLVHSSAANSLVELILSRLRQEDIVVEGVSPNFLSRYWPPALPEWSTKSVRDAFYASPKFPRLLKPDAIKDTISRGLDAGTIAYVGKASGGEYEPFVYKRSLGASDIEIADDIYLIVRERAEEYVAKRVAAPVDSADDMGGSTTKSDGTGTGLGGAALVVPPGGQGGQGSAGGVEGDQSEPIRGAGIAGFSWTGDVSPQKWMNFYTKVLSRFATGGGLKLSVTVDIAPPGGLTVAQAEETKVALRELGLPENLNLKSRG